MERTNVCGACAGCGLLGANGECGSFESCAEWRRWFGVRWDETRRLFGVGDSGAVKIQRGRTAGAVPARDCGLRGTDSVGVGIRKGAFAERFSALKAGSGKSWRVLSELCGLSKNTLVRYARGEREPSAESLRRIADYFGVTVDFLLGA